LIHSCATDFLYFSAMAERIGFDSIFPDPSGLHASISMLLRLKNPGATVVTIA
jgi:hypothetical protein